MKTSLRLQALAALASLILSSTAVKAASPSDVPLAQPEKKVDLTLHDLPTSDKPEHRIQWTWTQVSKTEYLVTAIAGGVAIGSALLMKPGTPHMTGTNGLDEAARNAIRQPTQAGRDAADTASTVGVAALAAVPTVVDAVLVTWVGDKNSKAALQMLSMDALSFSLILGTDGVVKNIVARPRPCTRNGAESCTGPDADRSFFSGHTATAFTAAGLVCVQHLNMHIYGNEALDDAACVAAEAAAAAVGTLRIAADKHYATDVLTGAAVGTIAGYVVPKYLHFDIGGSKDPSASNREEAPAVSFSIAPAMGEYNGVVVTGAFQ